MILLSKYKHFIAVILLTVYAFVAAPVQLWHSHSNSTFEKSFSADNDQKTSVVFSSDKADDTFCKICSHNYSVYTDDAIAVIITCPVVSTSNKAVFYLSIPLAPKDNFSNKGPPAFA